MEWLIIGALAIGIAYLMFTPGDGSGGGFDCDCDGGE